MKRRDIYYYRHRQKLSMFQMVASHFAKLAENQGLTLKDLALKLKIEADEMVYLMSGPGHWDLDTLSDVLLAMDAEMKYEIVSIILPLPPQ